MGPRAFYLLAVLLTLGGIALRFAPAESESVPARAHVAPDPVPNQGARAIPEVDRYASIVKSNAFSPARTPPAVRFVPEGLRKDTQVVAPPKKRAPAEPQIRLFGVTRGPGGAVALIEADPKVPGAELYRVGDDLRDGRVRFIGDSSVLIARPSGRLELTLPSPRGRKR
jgi:hypothetical protein